MHVDFTTFFTLSLLFVFICRGQTPSVAELNFLERAKWLDMYGVDLHPVIGEDNIEYLLGLTPTGVVVYRNKSKVAQYFW